MAAELIEAGVDVHDIYRRLYERVPIEKLHLVARAVERIQRLDECRLAVTYISAEDYLETGANESLTEGIIDHVRALEGAEVAAMVRDKSDGGAYARKVSLRSATGTVDVSAIAQRPRGRRPSACRRLLDRPVVRRAPEGPLHRGEGGAGLVVASAA